MAVLNKWQRIDRVISGKPFGNGSAGDVTISSDPNTRATIIGTATLTSGTAGSTAFANSDVVVLHQAYGTGAGQWEINRVVSGGGTTSLVFSKALNYTYVTGAQIVKIPQYKTATVSAHTITAWTGTTGGLWVIAANTSITLGGTLNASGVTGSATTSDGDGTSGGGFRGGGCKFGNPITAYSGDGATGLRTQQNGARGNGGGGGYNGTGFAGGGGGGNGTAGGAGGGSTYGGTGGGAGAADGVADLTNMMMGGGGGGASRDATSKSAGDGGSGGGIVILIGKNIVTSSHGVTSTGGAGGNGAADFGSGGGGAAGGSILFVCGTATLGTTKNLTAAGAGGAGGCEADGGAGGVGRIAVHHSGTVTGTTNPTFSDTTDDTLVESTSGGAFLLSQFV